MDFEEQYQQINAAIQAAQLVATDSAQLTQLYSEGDKARAAYTKVLNAQISASDQRLQGIVQELKTAAQALAYQSEAQTQLVSYLGKIQTAVGCLAKLATYIA